MDDPLDFGGYGFGPPLFFVVLIVAIVVAAAHGSSHKSPIKANPATTTTVAVTTTTVLQQESILAPHGLRVTCVSWNQPETVGATDTVSSLVDRHPLVLRSSPETAIYAQSVYRLVARVNRLPVKVVNGVLIVIVQPGQHIVLPQSCEDIAP